MGYFKNISLTNFRNFNSFKLEFSKNCNIFYGKNGSGKTNILEAISLLTKGRGFKKDKLSYIIKNNCNKFLIKSDFHNKNIVYSLVSESYEINNRILKKLSINDDQSKSTLNHLYKLTPFLVFVPETERLFISSPANRRSFLDRFIFNYTDNYNTLINQYNKSILERSKLLSKGNHDNDWLDQIEKNISKFGLQIYLLREKQVNSIIGYTNIFLNDFKLPFIIKAKLSDKYFNPSFDEDYFIKQLRINREFDSILGGCKIGPHKSDYLFYVNNENLVSQLSTGQQKTIILLMFLSQCKYLIDNYDRKPILLLDEVFSHLDEINRSILLTLVESFDLQVFMTGTTRNLFSFLSTNTNFCNITG